ncbi:Acetylxylan esterase precursor [Thalassoglobus neptunius]|uniref:Acetylxylan esterase n=1 Tax=Thalassoglobus neptunius TaxID=1938619 RepID=A0A5C5X0Y8_9PLAN|nr:alpha/beta hydrolase fold domain-containing protein [Thalassoglobus neptunius]TWT55825.1 Acetylxylan esterase precursor [Thalassoglobus neptunius]
MKHRLSLLAIVMTLNSVIWAQESETVQKPEPDRQQVYKTIDDVELSLHIFEPAPSDEPRPAIVFFFGGGWNGGSPSQFYSQCRHLADQGVVAMAADYRVKSRNQTTPFHCVQDGKSAMRWVRSHAEELNIDPDRIAAGGGSAGGHVAAAVATVPELNEPGEETSVSCVPNALVLFNPVYDNGPDGYGYERVKDRYLEISPLHNIRTGMPPAIVFLGTKDKLIPVSTAKAFQKAMQDVGSRSELMLFEGEPHGFFNLGRGNDENYEKTVAGMDEFLTSLGFIEAE